jgi:hypothetical protein
MRSTNKKQEKVETDPDGSESEGRYLSAKNGNKMAGVNTSIPPKVKRSGKCSE